MAKALLAVLREQEHGWFVRVISKKELIWVTDTRVLLCFGNVCCLIQYSLFWQFVAASFSEYPVPIDIRCFRLQEISCFQQHFR
jgi:hypothetical protein